MNADGVSRSIFPVWRAWKSACGVCAILVAFAAVAPAAESPAPVSALAVAGDAGARSDESPARDAVGGGVPEVKVLLSSGEPNIVRRGPGATFAIVSVVPAGAAFPVIAKRDDWYNIRLSDISTGWVHASLCYEYEDLSGLEFRANPRLFSRRGRFTVSGGVGGYAFDQKSNSLTLGAKLGYYLFDRVLFEGGLGWTRVNRPEEIVESLFGLRLEAEKFDMASYEMDLGFEILPGRQIAPFLIGGIGSSLFDGRSESSVNYGGGAMIFVRKSLALRWDLRNYRFRSGAGSARRTNNNISVTIGTSLLL
ncbi:MAG: outer membrane beta-barrel domain-containing protein [bacterium]